MAIVLTVTPPSGHFRFLLNKALTHSTFLSSKRTELYVPVRLRAVVSQFGDTANKRFGFSVVRDAVRTITFLK